MRRFRSIRKSLQLLRICGKDDNIRDKLLDSIEYEIHGMANDLADFIEMTRPITKINTSIKIVRVKGKK